jgi:hypothetical protein
MSRTLNDEKWFGQAEKKQLQQLIRKISDFSGVTLVTYTVMDNHFHLLVEVPPEREVSNKEIVRRYGVLYPRPTQAMPLTAEALGKLLDKAEGAPKRKRPTEEESEGKLVREDLVRRMHDVSWLMKTIKQRFASSFNASRERFGPVWGQRFKSVAVEGDPKILRTVAAYIDLNAVRAELVEDPKDYPFCGYAEALAGGKEALRGLEVLGCDLDGYRNILLEAGADAEEGEDSEDSGQGEGTFPLRGRLQYISDSYVLGSEEFVKEASKSLEGLRKKPVSPKPAGPAEGLAIFPGMHRVRRRRKRKSGDS